MEAESMQNQKPVVPSKSSRKNRKRNRKQKKVVDLRGSSDEEARQKASNYNKEMLNTVQPLPDVKANFNSIFQPLYKDTQEEETKLDYYFNSYSTYHIHEEMLQDEVRTLSYQNSILQNPHLFKGKVVLDIGCGTGVLSIFAAKAGAKHVHAVEMAKIHTKAREIVEINNLADVITVHNCKIEELELPVDKVDIIISEWMGYLLVYESMLDCVLEARDKWLAPDGLMFPDRATMHVAGSSCLEHFDKNLDFWNNVYGYRMSEMKKMARMEPMVEIADNNNIFTTSSAVLDIDLQTVTIKELDFSNSYKLKAERKGFLNNLVIWFDCFFSHGNKPIRLTTNPFMQPTHWKQTMLFLNEEVPMEEGDEVDGSLLVKKSRLNPRELDIKLSVHQRNPKYPLDLVQVFHLR